MFVDTFSEQLMLLLGDEEDILRRFIMEKLFCNNNLLMLLHLSPVHLVQRHCQRHNTKWIETLIPHKTANAFNSLDKSCLLLSTEEWLLFSSSRTCKQKNLYEKQVQSKNQIHVSVLINHNKIKVYTLSTFLDKPVSKNGRPRQHGGMFQKACFWLDPSCTKLVKPHEKTRCSHSVSSRQSLGVRLPSPRAGRGRMLLLYCPPATPQCTSAVTLGNYSLLITHSDMPVMGITEKLTAY